MNNAKSLLTINYKLDNANSFISAVGNDAYYFFVSNHIDANNAIRPYDNEEDTLVSSYQGMIFGKRVQSNDAILMIRRVNWTSNTVYAIYDHRDSNLYDLDYYVIVNEGTDWNVFKCLENGNGNPSTVSPSKTNVSSEQDDFFYPTDGYRWKFMYTIIDTDMQKFATNDYFPVRSDANVQSHAVAGSIDTIQVTTPGRGYNNYISGSFGVGDVRLNGDPKKYAISVPGTVTTNSYYDGCWIYISSGPGAGQYRLVDSYTSNSTHNFVVLTQEFDPTDLPQNGSEFEIAPSVQITGDGRETLPASARAIINSTGNTVSRIEMIDRGQNYSHGTGVVMASAAVGVTAQSGVVPIMSPPGGHGSDAPSELGGRYACVSVKLVGTESNTIITGNDYSQIGLLKNPQFNSVGVTLYNQNKDFYTVENVYKISTKQLAGTVQTNVDGNNTPTPVLTLTGTTGSAIASVGDTIFLNYASNYQIANVVSVSNTSLTIDSNALWYTGTGTANIFAATVLGSGEVSAFSTGSVTLTNATPNFVNGDVLVGAQTGVYGQANVVTITSANKTFNTFMQVFTYIGSMTQGNFTPDEVLFEIGGPTSANARFHSIAPDANTATSRIYTTNQNGVFTVGQQIKGTTSGAIASLTNKYLPDLVYGSGDIVYIEYGDSITRAAEQSESFKLVFAF